MNIVKSCKLQSTNERTEYIKFGRPPFSLHPPFHQETKSPVNSKSFIDIFCNHDVVFDCRVANETLPLTSEVKQLIISNYLFTKITFLFFIPFSYTVKVSVILYFYKRNITYNV